MICGVCFADPNSPLTQGYNLGILTLLGIIGIVLCSFALLFFNIYKRTTRPVVS